MADTKISAFPPATAGTGGVQAGVQAGIDVIFTQTAAGAALNEAANAAAQKTALGLAAIASSGSATDLTTGSIPAARIAVGLITDTMASLSVKPAVMAVSTSNLTLSGEQTIDGQLSSTSLVLLSGQTTGSQNGPWVTAAGAWTRPTWYPAGGTTQAFQFITVFVRLGATYQGSTWRITSAGAVTIDTTSTTWSVTPHQLNANVVVGTLVVANGGTGAATLTGYVKGSGTSALTASATVPTTDITGLATVATSGSASDLSAGTLPDARFPATLPAASGVNLTALNGSNIASGTVAVARGGTGASTLAANGVVLGNGTSAVNVTGAGTSGQVLTSNGAGVDPTFQAATGGSSPVITRTATAVTISNSTTETSIFGSYSVAGATMGTDGDVMRLYVPFTYLNNSGASQSWVLKVKVGGTVIYNDSGQLATTSANTRVGYIECIFTRASSTTVNLDIRQYLSNANVATTGIGDLANAFTWGNIVGATAGAWTWANNTTLDVTITASSATATQTYTFLSSHLMKWQ